MPAALTRPLRDPQTYRNLAYLALALPLGLVELVFLAVGLALSLVLLVTLLGFAVFERTVAGAFALARLERSLTSRLLRTEIGFEPAAAPPPGAGLSARLNVCLRCGTTWSRLGYLTARLPLAAATAALAGGILALSATLLAAPLYTEGAAVLATMLLGAALVPAALHVVNALAAGWALLGRALLRAA